MFAVDDLEKKNVRLYPKYFEVIDPLLPRDLKLSLFTTDETVFAHKIT